MKKYTDQQATDELMHQIDEIDAVRRMPRMSAKFKSWQSKTSNLLGNIFGRKAKPTKDFDNIVFGLASFSNQTPESKFDEVFQQGLMNAAVLLSSIVKDLQKNGLNNNSPTNAKPSASIANTGSKAAASNLSPAGPPADTPKPQATAKQNSTVPVGNKLFVICSEEKNIETELTNFLGKLGLVTIVIQEKTKQHVKLLAKLKENSDVGFAIVLMDPASNSLSHDAIFELGILVGALGSNRVCCLSETNVNILANYSGISYISADNAGAWKFMMIKYLKQAGFQVDANLAL